MSANRSGSRLHPLVWRIVGFAALGLTLAACSADPTTQLERVAKDWSLTIRAGQVIPVYPLSEDVQPGDVMIVPVSIKDQTRIYEEKGFLPIDQLVTRLDGLDYDAFYASGYWTGTFSGVPHDRPESGKVAADAPRAGFPSYSFEVDRKAGLQLALPIQGIPVGLGLMGTGSATGSVTISNAHTYGIDSMRAYAALLHWYGSDPQIRRTLDSMLRSVDDSLYLRIVTRVYLTSELDVSLVNAEAGSAGVDAGAAPGVNVPNPTTDPVKFKEAMDALSATLNTNAVAAPGGSIRIGYADRRSVAMKQTFDRPLVIGFTGFDVKVLPGGTLSVPIPSFTVLSGNATDAQFRAPVTFTDSELARAYLAWLPKGDNREKMIAFLKEKGVDRDPADVGTDGSLGGLLKMANDRFSFL